MEMGQSFYQVPILSNEEDDDRDDTTFSVDLTDTDSEWELMFRVSKWLIEASYVERVTDYATTANLSVVGILSILAVVIIHQRLRKH